MAATMLAVNERAGAQLSGIDTMGEPVALSAPDSHIFPLPDGRKVTIAASPIYTPMFTRFAAIMRRNDLLNDPRFKTAPLRRENLSALLAEIGAWILTFRDLDHLQTQVSEGGLAIGVVRSTEELAESEWAEDWGAIVELDDRGGSVMRMPGVPWRFGRSVLPEPGVPSFQGEDNAAILADAGLSAEEIDALKAEQIIMSRRSLVEPYDGA
jgi:crotonobetainyl-CoA:carnitine CoA-transferase CaiB-like acyl-CoA transferase